MRLGFIILMAFTGSGILPATERINHEGRILGALPVITNSILFNTINADAVVSAMQIFPRDNAWNEDISRRPVLTNSDAMITRIISDLPTRKTLQPFFEMNFVLVPDAQPPVPLAFDSPPDSYPDESDPPPYPFATNTPVETWPRQKPGVSLITWQRTDDGSDRHAIAVMPGSNLVWETWRTVYMTTGPTNWHVSTGAKFDLNSNALRPLFNTSADAAGLSMLGGLVRYDECQRGMVEHAIRLVVARTRHEFIYPATHYASSIAATNVNVPAMGQRLRLKSTFMAPTNWGVEEKAVVAALKKYGAIVADNGSFFSISVVPDQRFANNAFMNLTNIAVTNFDVIQTTTATQGPRSPGAPAVNAGADQNISLGTNATLQGSVFYTNAAPITVQWKLYSGPNTNVIFANAAQTNTTVSFSAPGVYTLMLSADDGIHTVAYDAMIITVMPVIRLNINRNGTNALLRWSGGSAPYSLERVGLLPSTQWNSVLMTNATSAVVSMLTNAAFFRIRGQP